MAQLPLERGVLLGKRKILVVDDVMLNRRLLGKMVESLGFDPLYSADGAEAINQFKQMRNEGDLFAILMDVQMPRVDGLEATKEIRSMEAAAAAAKARPTSSNDSSCSSASCAEGLRHHEQEAEPPTPCSRRVPIVGVSACTNADQLKSAALQGIPIDASTERPWEVVGMDLFMAKPVSRDRLAAALQTIREAQAWSAFEASATARASEPLRQPSMLMQAGGDGGASLGGAGSAGSGSCDSFASLSGGLDIQVRSRPGGQQVAQRSLGGCMPHALLDTDSAPPAKRLKLGRLGQALKEEACRQATCETPTSL